MYYHEVASSPISSNKSYFFLVSSQLLLLTVKVWRVFRAFAPHLIFSLLASIIRSTVDRTVSLDRHAEKHRRFSFILHDDDDFI